jgi:hypothetical protein
VSISPPLFKLQIGLPGILLNKAVSELEQDDLLPNGWIGVETRLGVLDADEGLVVEFSDFLSAVFDLIGVLYEESDLPRKDDLRKRRVGDFDF